MLATTTITDEMRARWEADARDRRERSEYGRTVGDVRSFLKKARRVQIAIRTGSFEDDRDVHFPCISVAAVGRMFKGFSADEFAASEFDPVERTLCIGTLNAIRKARSDT